MVNEVVRELTGNGFSSKSAEENVGALFDRAGKAG